MIRALAVVSVLVRTALRGLRAGVPSTVATVVTIAVTLLVVGAFALLALNMRSLLDRVGDEIQISVFLVGPVVEEDAVSWVRRAESIEGVDSVVFVSPKAALERFRRTTGGGSLLEGIEGNPLPASLELSLHESFRDGPSSAQIAATLRELPGVEDVTYGGRWTEGYGQALALVGAATWGFGAVLGLAALLIVSNAIRLAIHAREDEIDILGLVGASRTFVFAPFLIEGGLQGLLGGALAWAGLYTGFAVLVESLSGGFDWFIGGAAPQFFGVRDSLKLVGGGALLGLLGAALSLVGPRR